MAVAAALPGAALVLAACTSSDGDASTTSTTVASTTTQPIDELLEVTVDPPEPAAGEGFSVTFPADSVLTADFILKDADGAVRYVLTPGEDDGAGPSSKKVGPDGDYDYGLGLRVATGKPVELAFEMPADLDPGTYHLCPTDPGSCAPITVAG